MVQNRTFAALVATSASALLLGASLLLWSSIASAAANSDEKVFVLQLKWFHRFQFAGYYAALQQGYYSDVGLQVEIRQRDPSRQPAEQVLSGQADFGIADSSLLLRRASGDPVVALAAIFQHSPMVLMTLADSGLETPYDLIGKRVMYQQDVDDATIMAMFMELSIAEEDFTFVEHTFEDDVLITGIADAVGAYSTDQPYTYRSQGHEVNLISPVNYGIDFYGDTLFTSEAVIEQYPNEVLAFRRASIRGWQYALDHPGDIITHMLQLYGETLQKDRPSLEYEARMTRRLINPRLVEIGDINPSRYRRIAGLYQERGLIDEFTDLDGIYYESYFRQAETNFKPLLWIAAAALSAFLLFSFLLTAMNRRLSRAVGIRTQELYQANAEVARYLSIVNDYTLSLQVDQDLILREASRGFLQAGSYSDDKLIGRSFRSTLAPASETSVLEEMLESLQNGHSWHGELEHVSSDNLVFVVEADIEPRADEEGNFLGFTAIYTDITDKKLIQQMAITDPLTTLYNRLKLDEVVMQELKRAARGDSPFSIVLIDIDHFKNINDKYGHQRGDVVLRAVAKACRARVRDTDVLGRWGGEEFLVLCPDTDASGALELAESLRGGIARTHVGIEEKLTASFGVATYQADDNADSLLERADTQLYAAKSAGRNCVRGEPAQASKSLH